jgi:hypothetical protein
MWTIYVNSRNHAKAVTWYAASILELDSAKAEYDSTRAAWRIEIDCELKHRRYIQGFVDGLEWSEANK